MKFWFYDHLTWIAGIAWKWSETLFEWSNKKAVNEGMKRQ